MRDRRDTAAEYRKVKGTALHWEKNSQLTNIPFLFNINTYY